MKRSLKRSHIILIVAALAVLILAVLIGVRVREQMRLRDSDVLFINRSRETVGSVGLESDHSSSGTVNADSSPMGKGTRLFFEDVEWPVTLTVYADVEGRKPLASVTIEWEPPGTLQEQLWYVIARDGPQGVELTLSLNLNEKELVRMGEIVAENLRVDTSAGVIEYCWYPGHGWQGDGEDFVTLSFAPEDRAKLEQELSQTEGWQPFPVPDALQKCFESPYLLGYESHVDWSSLSEKGWFYFRNENDRQYGPGPYDFPDIVTAVYDSETGILYFLEYHS